MAKCKAIPGLVVKGLITSIQCHIYTSSKNKQHMGCEAQCQLNHSLGCFMTSTAGQTDLVFGL